MDKIEAKVLLDEFVIGLRGQSYGELSQLVRNPTCVEVRGHSGAAYQVEYEAVWDSQPGGVLRVVASIDDGGLISAMFPICSDFVITPRGEINA
jgi:hypothetical protein